MVVTVSWNLNQIKYSTSCTPVYCWISEVKNWDFHFKCIFVVVIWWARWWVLKLNTLKTSGTRHRPFDSVGNAPTRFGLAVNILIGTCKKYCDAKSSLANKTSRKSNPKNVIFKIRIFIFLVAPILNKSLLFLKDFLLTDSVYRNCRRCCNLS